MHALFFFFFFLAVPFAETAANDDGNPLELEFVNVLYRHGDRTPIDPYPNDPFKDPSNW